MHQLYVEIIKKNFLCKRIFSGKHYINNGQIALIADWKEKWIYVIDQILSTYDESDKMEFDVENAVKVFLIWYQNEKRRKIVLKESMLQELREEIGKVVDKKGKRIKEDLNRKIKQIERKYSINGALKEDTTKNVNTSRREDVVEWIIKVTADLAKYKMDKFDPELEKEYLFIIKKAFGDLEKIAEKVEENEKIFEESGENFKQRDTMDILPYLMECMEIIKPHVDRLNMLPSDEEEN